MEIDVEDGGKKKEKEERGEKEFGKKNRKRKTHKLSEFLFCSFTYNHLCRLIGIPRTRQFEKSEYSRGENGNICQVETLTSRKL